MTFFVYYHCHAVLIFTFCYREFFFLFSPLPLLSLISLSFDTIVRCLSSSSSHGYSEKNSLSSLRNLTQFNDVIEIRSASRQCRFLPPPLKKIASKKFIKKILYQKIYLKILPQKNLLKTLPQKHLFKKLPQKNLFKKLSQKNLFKKTFSKNVLKK